MRAALSLAALALLLNACVGAVNPIYEQAEHLVFEEAWLGTWQVAEAEPGSIQQIRLERYAGESSLAERLYHLHLTDEAGRVVTYRAGVVDVGGDRLVLDTQVEAQDPEPETSGWLGFGLMRLHTLNLIEPAEDGTIRFRAIRPDALADYLAEHPEAVRHLLRRAQRGGDERRVPLLTDSPSAIRDFLGQTMPEDVLGEPATFERVDDDG